MTCKIGLWEWLERKGRRRWEEYEEREGYKMWEKEEEEEVLELKKSLFYVTQSQS